jgi:hypothetical protein
MLPNATLHKLQSTTYAVLTYLLPREVGIRRHHSSDITSNYNLNFWVDIRCQKRSHSHPSL